MRRLLTVLAGALVLGLGGLFVGLSARSTNASAPPAKADGEPRMAASKIAHVTVYPDSALVTREVEVPSGSGLMELVVGPLPEATIATSLYTESSDTVRVLTTRFRSRPVREDTPRGGAQARRGDQQISSRATPTPGGVQGTQRQSRPDDEAGGVHYDQHHSRHGER